MGVADAQHKVTQAIFPTFLASKVTDFMNMAETPQTLIRHIYRYPVKGLSAEPIKTTDLTPRETIIGDRIYALEHGSHDFDPLQPKYFPKTKFLMLMRHEKLALIDSRYDAATSQLTLSRDGKQVAAADLSSPAGRTVIEQFFAAYLGDVVQGSPKVVSGDSHSFSDVAMKCLSIINLNTVRELGRVAGTELDPLRFRANVYVDGPPAWAEREWVGKSGMLGGAGVRFVQETTRCAATNVNPETGERDMHIPKLLQKTYDHANIGLYAEVTDAGAMSVDDVVSVNLES